MNVTIHLSDQNAAALEAHARAAQMPPDCYLSTIVERALREDMAPDTAAPKKSAWGLLADFGPGPTDEEIDENRRDMFRGFGELP